MPQNQNSVVLFEAGGHGFYPYWQFTKAGYQCKMIAPHSIPQKNRQKTDRIDASENVKDYLAGNFRFVNPPNQELMEARDVWRLRINVSHNIKKKKQYIVALTKRHGHFSDCKTNWTKEHMKWLATIELSELTRTLLNLELENLKNLQAHQLLLEKQVERFIAAREKHKKYYDYLIRLPGFGPFCATTILLEGGDLTRFSHPRKLMSYIGIIPGLYQSAGSNPHMAIVKTGNKYLRYAFVCASKVYADNRNLYSVKDLAAMQLPERVFLQKCQRRCNNRIRNLTNRGKHINKARCAVARELCGFIWEYVTQVIPQMEAQLQAA